MALDLDGDGIETISSDKGIVFDHDGDGLKKGTGWIGPDDGLLVFDRNGDGIINDGSELFGEYTPKYDGLEDLPGISVGISQGDGSGGSSANVERADPTKCKNGFEALAQEDTNGDGIVNHLDENWQHLKVWRDLNQDGVSQANELFTLEELGITGIDLNYKSTNNNVAGGVQTGETVYIKEDGSTGKVGQFDFSHNPFYREFTDSIEIPEDMYYLPDMQGSGAVRDLLEAAAGEAREWNNLGHSLETEAPLQAVLDKFSQAATRSAQVELMDDLLYRWAWTSGIFTKNRCPGYVIEHYTIPVDERAEWAKKVGTLEAFYGQYFYLGGDISIEDQLLWNMTLVSNKNNGTNNQPPTIRINWSITQISTINEAYDILKESVYNALVLQTRLASVFDLIELSIDMETMDVAFDFSKVIDYFESKLSADPVNGLSDLVDFNRASSSLLANTGWHGYDLVVDFIQSNSDTSRFNHLYEQLGLNVYGLTTYNPRGTSGNDVIFGGAGSDSINGGNGDDVLYGGVGDDTLCSGAGNDVLRGGEGNDKLYGGTGDDILEGGIGDDYLDGESGDDVLYGDEGDDSLYGGYGNDTLDGGSGNDYLEGGAGDDTYVFGKGYGHDRVNASDSNGGKRDTVRLVGLTAEDVEFTTRRDTSNVNYHNLIIRIKETGETLTIERAIYYSKSSFNSYSIQAIEFGDGSVLEWPELTAGGYISSLWTEGDDVQYGSRVDTLMYGGAGDDKLYGGAGHDILDGGSGNDHLEGGSGNDTYVFGKGYGHDTVNANDVDSGKRDTVRLVGLTADDVEFITARYTSNANYHNLIIRIKETGETLTIEQAIYYSGTNFNSYSIQAIELGDGTVMEWSDFAKSGLAGVAYTDGDDNLTATRLNSTLRGGAGNDKLTGEGGDDVLYGDEGDDSLYCGYGNDTLDGGSGNDYLEGGAGDDTYVFGKGYGHDRVNASDSNSGKRDIVRLVGLTAEDVEFTTSRYTSNANYHNLIIRIKETGETLTIERAIYYSKSSFNSYSIQAIEFGDGSVLEWSEFESGKKPLFEAGTDGNDTLYGSRLGSSLYGGVGNDSLRGDVGNDTLYGEQGNDILSGGDGNDILYGGEGDDSLYGGNGDDILSGGAGNDFLDGGAGNDIYVFGKGDGNDRVNSSDGNSGKRDIVRLVGLTAEDVEFMTSRNTSNANYHNLVIRIKETGETLTIERAIYYSKSSFNSYSIQAIEFGDGSVLEWPELTAGGYISSLWTEGDDVQYGSRVDTLMYGGAGDDKLYGGAGHDILDGGSGNDHLEGGSGNDTYVFGKGYGHDTVNANDVDCGKRDTVRLVGLTADDVEFITARDTSNANYHNLIIRIKETGETLTIERAIYYSGTNFNSYSIQAIELGDGTVMEWSDFAKSGLAGVAYTDGDDNLTATRLNSTLRGGAGNDKLTGESGDDVLYGDEGDDSLYGGYGNDTLDGGSGNDYLEGGAGDDTYVFGKGYGHDRVNASDSNSGKRDIVRLVGLTAEDVEFTTRRDMSNANYHNLIIRIKETGETLTIERAIYYSKSSFNSYSIQAIEFGDGSVLEWSEFESGKKPLFEAGTDGNDTLYGSRLGSSLYGGVGNDSLRGDVGNDTLYGEQGNDILSGGDGNDILYGGEGDDSLYGGNGDDILSGGAGNDFLDGGAGNDIYVFGKGDGHDRVNSSDGNSGKRDIVRLVGLTAEDVEFMTSRNTSNVNYHNLIIRIKETGETLTIEQAIHYSSTSFNSYSIQAIEFGDGSVLEWPELIAGGYISSLWTEGDDVQYGSRVDTLMYGGAGDDKLYGGAGHDILDGGSGNDHLEGGSGDDTYVFGKGYGHDTVNANDVDSGKRDTVRLVGLTADDVEFITARDTSNANYHNLIIRIKETGETLTIERAIYYSGTNFNSYSIQAIELGDGTVMEWSDFAKSGLAGVAYTDGDDNLTATRLNSTLRGGAGNDKLTGESGDDVLYGDEGDDSLYGGYGNDTLDGGSGNDYLEGGAGDDTYLFRAGWGQDTINNSGGGNDLLKFEDLNPAELWFGKSGNHLTIGLVGSSDKVTVSNWYYSSSYMVDTIEAGGSVITESQVAQMVQAMAAVGTPGGVDGQWTDEQKEALTPILSTYWKSAA
ncbi:hypothetical protein C4J81_13305 [Deltaproteobacteria bacterium Smac51]|nr:hypothetical protein C4J81_13305 [Deltaproteobacteria bacterium Smac51]